LISKLLIDEPDRRAETILQSNFLTPEQLLPSQKKSGSVLG
jgi:hypothetical protein